MRRRVGLLLGALLSGVLVSARSAPAAFSAERLARVDHVLQQYVDEGRLAGAVALVLHDGLPIYERAVGWSDKEAGRRMAPDTIFRVASQTKAFTSVAVLSLVEEGLGLAWALKPRTATAPTAWIRSAPSAGAAHTGPGTAWIPLQGRSSSS